MKHAVPVQCSTAVSSLYRRFLCEKQRMYEQRVRVDGMSQNLVQQSFFVATINICANFLKNWKGSVFFFNSYGITL